MNDRISMAAYRRQKAAETPHAARWAEYEAAMRAIAKRLGV